jgi:HK97 family phage prohead protease
MERKGLTLELKEDGAEQGAVTAVFSTFNVIDKDGDVTLPGAFEDGAPVRISAWGHKWYELPVGRGAIKVEPGRALLDGHFFMDTAHGLDTYRTVKGLGELQEWSYGYDVLESEEGPFNGQQVRLLKKLQVHEVSPVMLGAGIDTGTVGMKGTKVALAPHAGPKAPEGESWSAPTLGDFTSETDFSALPASERRRIATHAAWTATMPPEKFGDIKLFHHRPAQSGLGPVVWRGVAAAMAVLMGGRGGVDVPDADRRGIYNHLAAHYRQFDKEPPEFSGVTLDQEADIAAESLADVAAFIARTKSLADLRAKEGRTLSAANRERLARLMSAMRESLADIEKLLDETDPEKASAVMREYMRYQKIVAELVAV